MSETHSTRPYLIRAIHEWALDCGWTPQVLVATNQEGVQVPPGYARDDRITFNLHPQAVRGLELGNEWILFDARFGGKRYAVSIPVGAVLAVFTKENGEGIAFQDESGAQPPAAAADLAPGETGTPKPADPAPGGGDDPRPAGGPRRGGAPHLRRVK